MFASAPDHTRMRLNCGGRGCVVTLLL